MSADEGRTGSEGDLNLHLIVRAGERKVALPMTALRAVVPAPPLSRLPAEAPALAGLVALAGEPVAVVDLALLLGIDQPPARSGQMLVVIDDGNSQLALRVDGVEGHETLLPHLATGIDLSDSALGSTAPPAISVGRDSLFVLDIEAALADPRLTFTDTRSGA